MALADTMSRLTSLMATLASSSPSSACLMLLLGMAPVPLLTLAILVLAPTIGSCCSSPCRGRANSTPTSRPRP
jgi:hypothetical protein